MRTTLVIIAVLALCLGLYAQEKPAAPKTEPKPPVPSLLSQYPKVATEFLAQYPDEPVEKVVQAAAARLYSLVLVQQARQIADLQKRVEALEKVLISDLTKGTETAAPAPGAAEPNQVKN
jgi:hypothetical protein